MTTYTQVFGNNTIPPSQYAFSEVSLSADASLNWPENSTGNSLIAPLMEVTATSGPWSLTLPSAAEVSEGRDFVVRNIGSNSFYVKNASGTILATVAAGEAKYFYLTNNSSVAGTWSVFTYGTGTSSADASALVGNGLRVSGSTLATVFTPNQQASTYSILSTDASKLLDFTGGSSTWNLPNPSGITAGVFYLISNSGTGTLTVNASTNGGTIDGNSSKQLQPDESMIVVLGAASTNWVSVGYGRSTDFQFTQLLVDVSLGGTGDITITSAQAANKLWYFTGTSAGDRTINIPAVASIYFIRVGAIGAGNSLTFTTGSGSTVSFDMNESYTIYCDGTNVYAANTAPSASQLALEDGSASSPSLNFNLDTNLGAYRIGADNMGFTANGSLVWSFDTTGLTLGSGKILSLPTGGSATAPALTFTSDTNLGLYRVGADEAGFSANGGLVWSYNSSGITLASSKTIYTPTPPTSQYNLVCVGEFRMYGGSSGDNCKITAYGGTSAGNQTGFYAYSGTPSINSYGAMYVDTSNTAVIFKSGNVSGTTKPIQVYIDATRVAAFETTGNFVMRTPKTMGYGTGSGNNVDQITNRNTGVTIDAPSGKIKLASAAGSATWASFVVTNNTVGVDDCILITQRSGTDIYEVQASAVAAGSFTFSFHTTGGTTTEQPEFNFVVIKGSVS